MSSPPKHRRNGFELYSGYLAAKKAKLEEQFTKEAVKQETSTIFHGIAIHVDGFTDPSLEELKKMMLAHGGRFHVHPSRKTTHIIATHLPDTKVKQLRAHQLICHPNWIVNSIKANKLLDYRDFLIYTNASSSAQPLINENAAKSSTLDAKDGQFLEEFYKNSRLHHISTMSSYFKSHISTLRKNNQDRYFPARDHLRSEGAAAVELELPVYGHIDMDCFFVSVGLKSYPHLRGLPVVVTHSKGYTRNVPDGPSMAEIASCSYETRQFGIKNGMLLGQALELCPNLHAISYNFEGYQEVAKILYDTVAQYTLDIQAVSCDEMLMDLSDLLSDCRIQPEAFAEFLRKEIRDKTGCTASLGIGPNLLLARLATRVAKPDGVKYVRQKDVEQFIKNVPAKDLPGVGRIAERKMARLGIEFCADLQSLTVDVLRREFGPKLGRCLYEFSRGVDKRKLNLMQDRKSVSAEVNYGIRFNEEEEAIQFLNQLSEEVAARMLRLGPVQGRCITLKLMVRSKGANRQTAKFLGHGVCDCVSKSITLSSATNSAANISTEAVRMFTSLKIDPMDLRGVGIQVSKLDVPQASEAGCQGGQTMSIVQFLQRSSFKTDQDSDEEPIIKIPMTELELLHHIQGDVRKHVKRRRKMEERSSSDSSSASSSSTTSSSSSSSSSDDTLDEESDCEAGSHRANLNGKRKIEDLRQLFRDWVASTCLATNDDQNTLIEFLVKLIEDEDQFELVYLAMKSLWRTFNRVDNSEERQNWISLYRRVRKSVQAAMQAKTGKLLWLNFA